MKKYEVQYQIELMLGCTEYPCSVCLKPRSVECAKQLQEIVTAFSSLQEENEAFRKGKLHPASDYDFMGYRAKCEALQATLDRITNPARDKWMMTHAELTQAIRECFNECCRYLDQQQKKPICPDCKGAMKRWTLVDNCDGSSCYEDFFDCETCDGQGVVSKGGQS